MNRGFSPMPSGMGSGMATGKPSGHVRLLSRDEKRRAESKALSHAAEIELPYKVRLGCADGGAITI